MGKKPKLIRDKLKDKIMIFGDFFILKKKKQNEKITSTTVQQVHLQWTPSI